MTLQIADDPGALLMAETGPAEVVATELIVLGLYGQRRISSGKAAQLLAETREEFLERAARADVPYLDLTPAELDCEFGAADRATRAHDL